MPMSPDVPDLTVDAELTLAGVDPTHFRVWWSLPGYPERRAGDGPLVLRVVRMDPGALAETHDLPVESVEGSRELVLNAPGGRFGVELGRMAPDGGWDLLLRGPVVVLPGSGGPGRRRMRVPVPGAIPVRVPPEDPSLASGGELPFEAPFPRPPPALPPAAAVRGPAALPLVVPLETPEPGEAGVVSSWSSGVGD